MANWHHGHLVGRIVSITVFIVSDLSPCLIYGQLHRGHLIALVGAIAIIIAAIGAIGIGTIIIKHAHLLKVLEVGTVYPIQVSDQGNPVLFVQLSVQSEIKAPAGSCADQCSDLKPGSFKSGATCQCDASCAKYKDCCSDYAKYCNPK